MTVNIYTQIPPLSAPQSDLLTFISANPSRWVNPRRFQLNSIDDKVDLITELLPAADDQRWDGGPDSRDAFIAALATVTSTNSSFRSHTNTQLADLPSILDRSKMGVINRARTAPLDQNNPCTEFENFIGSLFERGRQLLADAEQFLSDIINQIVGGVVLVVQTIVDQITQWVSDAVNLIADELANLANIIEEATGIGALFRTLAQFVDPCLGTIYRATANTSFMNKLDAL